MTRALKYDIPGTDWRRSLEEVRDAGWEAIFAPDLKPPLRMVVEIGYGRGEFLTLLAQAEPETAFVGIERSFKRSLKLARRVAATPLRNLRLVNAMAERVVIEALQLESVETFWINFPDPWPKKRHAKHRIVQPAFVSQLAQRLRPGGLLRVATDDRPYAEQIDEVLAAQALLENLHAPAHWLPEEEGRSMTAYELAWRAEGRPLHFFAYRRRA